MTTTHLYRTGSKIQQIHKKTGIVEKDIQTIIEKDMETYLGIRFIATEYSTGKVHGGRIDTLGIDENGSPVIIEYKRFVDNGAAIQGLFYFAWLMDHKSEFELEVLKEFGEEISQNIDWSQPRVLCIANDFHKYVIGAIDHMGPNIELIQYQIFNNDILIITDIHTKNQPRIIRPGENITITDGNTNITNVQSRLNNCNDNIKDIFKNIKDFLINIDDTIIMKETQNYFAFRTNKNFCVIKFYSKSNYIKIGTIIDPDSINLEEGFTRDMRNIHGNDGPLDIIIRTPDDFEKAKSLLIRSYNNT
jgi:predicted transport protein